MDSGLQNEIYKRLCDFGCSLMSQGESSTDMELARELSITVESWLRKNWARLYGRDVLLVSDSSKSAQEATGCIATMTVNGHVFNLRFRSLACWQSALTGFDLIVQGVDGTWLSISTEVSPEPHSWLFKQSSALILGEKVST